MTTSLHSLHLTYDAQSCNNTIMDMTKCLQSSVTLTNIISLDLHKCRLIVSFICCLVSDIKLTRRPISMLVCCSYTACGLAIITMYNIILSMRYCQSQGEL